MIGTALAQFEITAKLGEGGMGEVWLADDTKLGRQVALKILPADVAGDAERMARFEREAKVLASLSGIMFSIAPDGQRILAGTISNGFQEDSLDLVIGWRPEQGR